VSRQPARTSRRAVAVALLLLAAALGVVWWSAVREQPAPDAEIAADPEGLAADPSPAAPVRHSLADWLGRRGLDWIVVADERWLLLPGPTAVSRWAAAVTEFAEWFGPATDVGGFRPVAAEPDVVLVPPDSAWLVYVVDDVGFRPSAVRRMLDWQRPMIFSVIPNRPYSRRSAAMVTEAGGDLFLHQPMEPEGWPAVDPGAGALLLRDDPAVWREQLSAATAAVPGVLGLNNHMGSRFTADHRAAAVVAQWAADEGLFVLDSLTAPRSRLYQACRDRQRACARRDVFLDDERTDAAIDARIAEWLRTARRRGLAVAIGHPHDRTMSRLEAAMASMDQAGLRWVGFDRWARYTQRRHEGGD
jgi:polysaccharide deacetylase 2 family uncharacterized protein YibQ